MVRELGEVPAWGRHHPPTKQVKTTKQTGRLLQPTVEFSPVIWVLTQGLTDPRKRRSKRMVWQVVAFVIVSLMAGKRSLQEIEDASVTFSGLVRGLLGIYDKISDNTIGWLIVGLKHRS